MARRLPAISLLIAWLCASGATLDVAQVFAWARMFTGYAKTESVAAAVRDTFDPGRPCAICRAVSRAREAAGQRAPAVPPTGTDKMVLICERSNVFVAGPEKRAWPDSPRSCAVTHSGDVPVPPPRALPV
jgi:hypothetical protein